MKPISRRVRDSVTNQEDEVEHDEKGANTGGLTGRTSNTSVERKSITQPVGQRRRDTVAAAGRAVQQLTAG